MKLPVNMYTLKDSIWCTTSYGKDKVTKRSAVSNYEGGGIIVLTVHIQSMKKNSLKIIQAHA